MCYTYGMKYFCNATILNNTSLETIKTTYPRVKVIEGLVELKEVVKSGDSVIFDSVLELDSSGMNSFENIYNTYKWFVDNDIDVMFDRSSNCDYEAIRAQIRTLIGYGVKLPIDTFFRAVLDLEVSAYINVRDAQAVRKKNAQLSSSKLTGKNYGRPKGSTAKSDRKKKAMQIILENCRDFKGTLSDDECLPLTGISRASYYRYKKDLKAESEKTKEE